jgi:thiol-disulfide isomerase/thioredoxin
MHAAFRKYTMMPRNPSIVVLMMSALTIACHFGEAFQAPPVLQKHHHARTAPHWVATTLHFEEDHSALLLLGAPKPEPQQTRNPAGEAKTMTMMTSTAPKSKTQTQTNKSVVQIVRTIHELLEVMDDDDGSSSVDDQLVLIKYYAYYCKVCQRAGVQLKKVAMEYPDIKFAKVHSLIFPDTAKTLRSLGVTKFPFLQVYRQGKCVASFSSGGGGGGPFLHCFANKVRDTLDACRQRTQQEWDEFETEFSKEIDDNLRARRDLGLL